MFGAGSLYAKFNYFWLLGALLPAVLWVLVRHLRVSAARHLNAPVMLGAMAWLPPATPLSFWTWGFFGLLFNYWIRRRFAGWWRTYNYVTAAGLDAGLVLSTIVIFFAITLPGVDVPQWWGNVDVYNTLVCVVILTLPFHVVFCLFLFLTNVSVFRTRRARHGSRPYPKARLLGRRAGDGQVIHPGTDGLTAVSQSEGYTGWGKKGFLFVWHDLFLPRVIFFSP